MIDIINEYPAIPIFTIIIVFIGIMYFVLKRHS
jgi:cbb3-type cytochrome oxidase subunit 3